MIHPRSKFNFFKKFASKIYTGNNIENIIGYKQKLPILLIYWKLYSWLSAAFFAADNRLSAAFFACDNRLSADTSYLQLNCKKMNPVV